MSDSGPDYSHLLVDLFSSGVFACERYIHSRVNPVLMNATERVSYLLPSLISHTWMTPKDVLRVICPLDPQQAFVVLSPECMLPVRLTRVILVRVSN